MALRLLILVIIIVEYVAALDWPDFRGPQRNGQCQETGLLRHWPAEGPPLRWSVTGCGRGYASVTRVGDLILTAGCDEAGEWVLARDAADGALRWRSRNGAGQWRPARKKRDWASSYGGARSTPVIADGLVYQLGVGGRLACFALADGTERWQVDLVERYQGRPNEWGYSESVLVRDGLCYVQPGGEGGYIVALDAATGAERWADRQVDDRASNASASIATIAGVRQLITMTTVTVVGLDAATGDLLWQVRHANRYRENCAIPQYVDGLLWVSSGYRHGSEAWEIARQPDGGFVATQRWRYNKADNLHHGPIIRDGLIFGSGYDHRGAFCLDLATGTQHWRNKAIGRATWLWADGLAYVLEEAGRLHLVDPVTDGWRALATLELPSDDGIHLSHPMISHGHLVLRYQDRLLCYDLREQGGD